MVWANGRAREKGERAGEGKRRWWRKGARVVGCFWFQSGRKCGDRKFSLGRIIDRAEDIQSERARSDKLCGTRSINRRRRRRRRPP